jgi:signal transduction histidine kinase
MSIKTKLLGSFILVFLLTVIVGWRGIAGMADINESHNHIKTNQFLPAQKIANANIALVAWNRATLNHVLAENIARMEQYELIMLEQRNALHARFSELSGIMGLSQSGRALIQELQRDFDQAEPIRDRVVQLSRGGNQEQARTLLQTDLRSLIDEMDEKMTRFLQLQEMQIETALIVTDERYRQGFVRIALFIMFALGISILVNVLLWKGLMKAVNELVRGAISAAGGDLEQAQLTITSKDEFKLVGDAFNNMLMQLADSREKLLRQEKLAVLGQLAGGIAHELRNPLGGIKNSTYFLKMVLEQPTQEVTETLDILNKEIATSERIISDILEYASSKEPIKLRVDLNDVVQKALTRNTIPENIEVMSQVQEALPGILADPDKLSQVFENLILNALQAMSGGGRLIIKSEAPSPQWVAISFTDTGIGIMDEDLDKVFEPLYSGKAKGIGLGLAIVKRLVEQNAGTVEVQSQMEKGTTFTVKLPIGVTGEI